MKRLLTAAALMGAVVATSHGEVADRVAALDSVAAADAPADTLAPLAGSNWLMRLYNSGFDLNDPRIHYPRFPQMCVDVYNWANATFNYFDPDYVVDSGRNRMLSCGSLTWGQNYTLSFSRRTHITMVSDTYSDVGVSLSFMGISIGHNIDADRLFHSQGTLRNRYDFGFSCSRFSFNLLTSEVAGGAKITELGDYLNANGRHPLRISDVYHKHTMVDAYYFFNHTRYSQQAAYNYGKLQRRSAGSPIFGLSYSQQDVWLGFSQLPPEIFVTLPPGFKTEYNFSYTDYGIMAGYAYNRVVKPERMLVNVTFIPSVGYRSQSVDAATAGINDMFSTNVRFMGALVYNRGDFFAAASLKANGSLYLGMDYTFFASGEALQLTAGYRF